MEKDNLTRIAIGQFIVRNELYLGTDNLGRRTWTDDVNMASFYNSKLTLKNIEGFIKELDIPHDNYKVIPVKKIVEYQLEDF
jgi:hypothetical protein